MAKPICADYGQQFLLPPALEDWVPKDHPVRFIREYVDQLNLQEVGFVVPDGSEGRPPYAAGLLLKIWLYGYLHRVRSTRRLEAACREHMALLWLSGMIAPDHNSLWRFWRDNKKGIRQLVKHSAQVALKQGLVGLVLQALDGTKIAAVASGRSGWSKKQMQELLQELDMQLREAEQQIETAGAVEEGTGYRLPDNLQDKQALREAVKAGLKEVQESGRKHYHRHEPDARRMQCDGKNRFGYNAQAVVDQQSGVVMAAEVTVQENDIGQLVPLTQQAKENVQGPSGSNPVTVADSGYGTGADIAAAADKSLNVLVYPQEGASSVNHPYHARHFTYDPNTDSVRCPRGEVLKYERSRKKASEVVKIYRCKCQDCPVKEQCSKDKKGREITVWAHTLSVQAMRQRLSQPQALEQLRQRGRLIERLFAQIKQHEGFRRWTFRGLEEVRTQWAMLCCMTNLRVLFNQWRNALA
jgi:transposase